MRRLPASASPLSPLSIHLQFRRLFSSDYSPSSFSSPPTHSAPRTRYACVSLPLCTSLLLPSIASLYLTLFTYLSFPQHTCPLSVSLRISVSMCVCLYIYL